MNSQKGFAPVLIILVGLIMIGGGVYVYDQKNDLGIFDKKNNMEEIGVPKDKNITNEEAVVEVKKTTELKSGTQTKIIGATTNTLVGENFKSTSIIPKEEKEYFSKNTNSGPDLSCNNGRYKKLIFPEVKITKDMKYGSAKNINGENENLLFDLYEPKEDEAELRPLIIFMHGGGFTSGTKDGDYLPQFMSAFAKAGYVAASIEYRLGIEEPKDEKATVEAIWRAGQDLKAAIRFARENSEKRKIDTSKIFIGGGSAGGYASMFAAYASIDDLKESGHLELIDQNKWGTLEGDGNLGYSTEVAAVFNLWGAIPDLDWIDRGESPIHLIHSKNDTVSPYNYGEAQKGIYVYGSLPIYNKAKDLGIYTSIKTYDYVGHKEGLNPPYLEPTIISIGEFLYPLLGCDI